MVVLLHDVTGLQRAIPNNMVSEPIYQRNPNAGEVGKTERKM